MKPTQLPKSKLVFNHGEYFTSLGAGESVTLLLAESSQSIRAFDVRASASQACAITVSESPTTSADGAFRRWGCTIWARTNDSDTPPPCPVALSATPTVSNDGTELERGSVGLDASYQSPALLLKPGTNYLVRLTNTSGMTSSGVLSVELCIIPSLDYLLTAERERDELKARLDELKARLDAVKAHLAVSRPA